jgi:hypothetical protein
MAVRLSRLNAGRPVTSGNVQVLIYVRGLDDHRAERIRQIEKPNVQIRELSS